MIHYHLSWPVSLVQPAATPLLFCGEKLIVVRAVCVYLVLEGR